MMGYTKKIVLTMMSLGLCAGCSVFSPVKVTPMQTYVIDAIPEHVVNKPRHARSIVVSLPEVDAIYNTTEMAYTTKPYQLAYFAKSSWVATPAKMLQPLIIETLQNTHYFHAVSSPLFAGEYDLLLNTQLLMLQQDFSQGASAVHVILRAQLVSGVDRHVIATKQFTVVESAPEANPYGGVVATNRAVKEILKQLAAFCVSH